MGQKPMKPEQKQRLKNEVEDQFGCEVELNTPTVNDAVIAGEMPSGLEFMVMKSQDIGVGWFQDPEYTTRNLDDSHTLVTQALS